MKYHKFITETIIEKPLETVFAFFSDAANLQELTPPWLHFKIISKLPIEMKADALIDYQLKLFGIPFHWRTKIFEWNPPDYFVDIQLKGPYKEWIHTHRFEKHGNKTIMKDEVKYALPFGSLSAPVRYFFVKKNIEKIFEYRTKQLVSLL
ncbi:MAG: SRPBCC family protein [Calditrichaceae bacterium]